MSCRGASRQPPPSALITSPWVRGYSKSPLSLPGPVASPGRGSAARCWSFTRGELAHLMLTPRPA